MIYAVLAVLMLGVLIILHEAGHFWAARLSGIEVQEFSAGMGPLLLQKKSKRGTLFSVRLFPIGGYCQFYGEGDEEEDPRAFEKQPILARLITIVSGPLMNFVTAYLVIVLLLSAIGIETAAPIVGAVEENAQSAGLRLGDRILSVDGQDTGSVEAISSAIAASEGREIRLTVERDGTETLLEITPFFDETLNRWRVGFSFGMQRLRLSLRESIPFSFAYNAESAGLILKTLKNMAFRGEGIDEVTGPVGTVYVIQEATREGGLDVYVELAALISVNLAIFNLLPIPGLDGSRLLFLLVEAIRRKPVKKELEGAIHMAGFALLIGLMIILTYRDIAGLLLGGRF